MYKNGLIKLDNLVKMEFKKELNPCYAVNNIIA